MESTQRWRRGCGSGIGLSGHKNQYRLGVGINNWVEDFQAKQDASQGKSLYNKHIPFSEHGASTTMKTSFVADGKFGPDIIPERKDLAGWDQPVSQENLFSHGTYGQGDKRYHATLHDLTYRDPAEIYKDAGRKKVNDYIWSGDKFNDAHVPVEANSNRLTIKPPKEAGTVLYATESQTAFSETAKLAFGTDTKRQPIMHVAEGGQKAQIGRKCKGPCSSLCDSNYHKIGLRR